MQDYLIIFLGQQARQNIYFKVFDDQDIYFKKLPAPPPQSTVRPLTKRDQFQPFTNRTDCYTKHITMPNGLLLSYFRNLKSTRNKHNKFLKYKISICLDRTYIYIVLRVPYTCNFLAIDSIK